MNSTNKKPAVAAVVTIDVSCGSGENIKKLEVKIHNSDEYISRQLLLHGGYEKNELKILQSLIQPGDVVMDVGANIGVHTLQFSMAVGPNGRVLSFEPDPDNLALLRHNVDINGCKNVTIYPFALGSSTSIRKFYLCDRNKGKQGFADLDGSNKFIEVEVRRAADIIDEQHPSLIKVDVEGAEPLVLQGMNWMPKNIFFEFVPKQLIVVNNDPLTFLNNLVEKGYSLYRVESTVLVPVLPQEMTNLAMHTGYDYNVLAQKY